MVTVVSLGIEAGDLTKAGERAVLSAKKVLVRTALTRSYQNVTDLGVPHETLDRVYKTCRSFRSLHKKLALEVKRAEREFGEVVYCVDGSATEDNSVKELLKKRGKIQVIGGVSKSERFASLARFSACSYAAASAYEAAELAAGYSLPAPLVVYDLDDPALAADLKILLSDKFGEETDALFIRGDKVKKIKLYELDRQKKYDYLTAVCVEKQDLLQKTRFSLSDLEEIIRRLRRPDGCPWDRAQTPDSVKMSAVEEAYELLDAVLSGDPDKIKEEAGDVMMQAVFHAVLQEERGAFNLSDVLEGVCVKLITRHTHVFGQDKARSEADALSVWEKNKMTEKSQHTFSDAVNDVPTCFPALLQAQKIAKRLGKGGWETDGFTQVKAELLTKLSALENALSSGDKDGIKGALGGFLFVCACLCRAAGADGEEALLEKLEKIKRLYTVYERMALEEGKDVNALTEEERALFLAKAKEAVKCC